MLLIPTDYIGLTLALPRVLVTGNMWPQGPSSVAVTVEAAVGQRRLQLVEALLALIALSTRHTSLALTLASHL